LCPENGEKLKEKGGNGRNFWKEKLGSEGFKRIFLSHLTNNLFLKISKTGGKTLFRRIFPILSGLSLLWGTF